MDSMVADIVKNITGSPAIKAHKNCVFHLNDDLDVLRLKKRLQEVEKKIVPCRCVNRPGISDAPKDGHIYGRKDGEWVRIEVVAILYVVSFIDWNRILLKAEVVRQGDSATAPSDPHRLGHTFTGWEPRFDNVQRDLEVAAQYQVNTYTITLCVDPPGSGNVAGGGAHDFDKTIPISATPGTGWVFVEWIDADGVAVSGKAEFTWRVRGDDTLTAMMEKVYAVTFTAVDPGSNPVLDFEITIGEIKYTADNGEIMVWLRTGEYEIMVDSFWYIAQTATVTVADDMGVEFMLAPYDLLHETGEAVNRFNETGAANVNTVESGTPTAGHTLTITAVVAGGTIGDDWEPFDIVPRPADSDIGKQWEQFQIVPDPVWSDVGLRWETFNVLEEI
jgi:hypothetical protein